MKKLKQTVLILASAGMLSVQAHAAELSVNTLPSQQSVAAFSQQDIQGLFDQTEQPMQLAALSRTEMKETEGTFIPAILAGMLLGGGLEVLLPISGLMGINSLKPDFVTQFWEGRLLEGSGGH